MHIIVIEDKANDEIALWVQNDKNLSFTELSPAPEGYTWDAQADYSRTFVWDFRTNELQRYDRFQFENSNTDSFVYLQKKHIKN